MTVCLILLATPPRQAGKSGPAPKDALAVAQLDHSRHTEKGFLLTPQGATRSEHKQESSLTRVTKSKRLQRRQHIFFPTGAIHPDAQPTGGHELAPRRL